MKDSTRVDFLSMVKSVAHSVLDKQCSIYLPVDDQDLFRIIVTPKGAAVPEVKLVLQRLFHDFQERPVTVDAHTWLFGALQQVLGRTLDYLQQTRDHPVMGVFPVLRKAKEDELYAVPVDAVPYLQWAVTTIPPGLNDASRCLSLQEGAAQEQDRESASDEPGCSSHLPLVTRASDNLFELVSGWGPFLWQRPFFPQHSHVFKATPPVNSCLTASLLACPGELLFLLLFSRSVAGLQVSVSERN